MQKERVYKTYRGVLLKSRTLKEERKQEVRNAGQNSVDSEIIFFLLIEKYIVKQFHSYSYSLVSGELQAFKGFKAERKTVVINHGLDNTFGVFYGPQMSKQEWNVTQNSNLEQRSTVPLPRVHSSFSGIFSYLFLYSRAQNTPTHVIYFTLEK